MDKRAYSPSYWNHNEKRAYPSQLSRRVQDKYRALSDRDILRQIKEKDEWYREIQEREKNSPYGIDEEDWEAQGSLNEELVFLVTLAKERGLRVPRLKDFRMSSQEKPMEAEFKDELIRLGNSAPELREHLKPIIAEVSKEARKDPYDEAYDLIMDGAGLTGALHSFEQDLTRALQGAKRQVEQLDRVGSGRLSAPSILGSDTLKSLQSLQNFVDSVVSQIEDLKKHGR